jgi:hypothetical protein
VATTKSAGLIFVSCGQVTDPEKALGTQVCAIVRELTPHEPYFAENQNSLEALTKNILGSLDDGVGLIAPLERSPTVAQGERYLARARAR